jgi:hypothetical protein
MIRPRTPVHTECTFAVHPRFIAILQAGAFRFRPFAVLRSSVRAGLFMYGAGNLWPVLLLGILVPHDKRARTNRT